MKTSRRLAFDILLKVHKDKAYSNLALDSVLESENLNSQDRAFVSALTYGVIERTITLDYQISKYLSQPLKKLKPQVLVILRMGAYQLLFMDKIPPSAAVNESVKLTKECGCAFASGLVNAVLHKISAKGILLPYEKDILAFYSIKYSCPQWIIKMWIEAYGEDNAIKICESALETPKTVLRVNTLKTDADSLIESLLKDGISAEKSEICENAVVVSKAGSLKRLQAYNEGLFHVQDIASQLCCMALNAEENETVLDVCAAPGGKSFTTAQYMKNTGKIISCDIYPHRLKLIEQGAQRLGVTNITTLCNDASAVNPALPMADKILCDVPCSGLGVMGRKPEIRFKESAEVDKLAEIQYSIILSTSKYLKPGGVMVYSTCSLNPNENEKIYNKFLLENSDFEPITVLPELKRHGDSTPYITLMPHIHQSDGFFISALRRKQI